MYSTDFDTYRKNTPKEYEAQFVHKPTEEPETSVPTSLKKEGGLLSKVTGLLGGLELDDILLIAIGVLLLLDSDEDNDVIVIFIALMLFF